MDEIESISRGEKPSKVKQRKQEAYDNIMDALGIKPSLKVTLRNKNNDLLSLYVEAPSKDLALNGLLNFTSMYSRNYQYIEIPGIDIYYIVEKEDILSMGELTPYAFLKYKYQGYSITKSAILDSIKESNGDKL
jgi:hypothetical protein